MIYDIVPFNPTRLNDRWAVLWANGQIMGCVFTGRQEAETFAAEMRAAEAASGGRTGDWFIPIPPGTRVRIKTKEVRHAINCQTYLMGFPDPCGGREGLVQAETDHEVNVLLEGDTAPLKFSKRWVWVL